MKRFLFIATDGIPIILVALAVSFLFFYLGIFYVAVPLLLFAIFTVFFFRDPERVVAGDPDAVLAPADGRVVELIDSLKTPLDETGAEYKKLSIFMSPLNVHINRIPWGGVVKSGAYSRGRFSRAYTQKASLENENNIISIEDEKSAYRFFVKQIAGINVRRIVCRVNPGDTVQKGQRFGMIKYGSRVEVFIPAVFSFTVGIGTKVKGGQTVIGRRK